MDGLRRLLAVLFIVGFLTLPAAGQAAPPPQGQGVSVGALVEKITHLEIQVIEMRGDISNLRAATFRTVATKSTQEVFALVCFLISYDAIKYIMRRYAVVKALGNARRTQDERASSFNAELESQLKAERLRRIAIEDTLASITELNTHALKTNANLSVLDDTMRSIVGDRWPAAEKAAPVKDSGGKVVGGRGGVPPWLIRIIAVLVSGALLITYLGVRP